MKKIKIIVSLVLIMSIISVSFLPSAFAKAKMSYSKEEIVYANLTADGAVEEINVVNMFTLDKDGEIIDHGKYSSVRNMITTDEITNSDGVITANVAAGKFFYEGKLTKNILPWKISIQYYLDDLLVSPADILGQSGKLTIKMKIRKNKLCKTNFFKDYALQIAFSFDTGKYSNIKAKGATVANVGKNKQLTFTALPGSSTDARITSNVTDFEMQSVAINGIKLNLDVNVDSSRIKDKISQISEAASSFDNASNVLYDGTQSLLEGTGILSDGTGALADGVKQIYTGSSTLNNGLSAISEKSSVLRDGATAAFQAVCSAVQNLINVELSSNNMEPISLTPENYPEQLDKLLTMLKAKDIYDKAYATAKAEVTKQVNEQADQVYSGYLKQNEETVYKEYLKSQADELYKIVAKQAIAQELGIEDYTSDELDAFLKTDLGKDVMNKALKSMTKAQKNQILKTALTQLTDDQKSQILQGALKTLTKVQKAKIRNGYIEQLMADKSVTSKIDAAVATVSSSAKQISEAKGQLDNFKVFCQGINDYTVAVDQCSTGVGEVTNALNMLSEKTEVLDSSMKTLNEGVGNLLSGTGQLKDGTNEFVDRTNGIDKDVDTEINNMLTKVKGKNTAPYSFVSSDNKNITSVQFVIKTAEIKQDNSNQTDNQPEAELNFWQKLLKLFGLYHSENE